MLRNVGALRSVATVLDRRHCAARKCTGTEASLYSTCGRMDVSSASCDRGCYGYRAPNCLELWGPGLCDNGDTGRSNRPPSICKGETMIPCDWDDLDNSAKYRAATKHWWDGWVPFSKRCIPGGMVYGLVRDYHADWITHQKYPNGLVQTITATGWGYQSKLRFLRKAQFLKFQTDQTELILRGWQAAKSEADCNARHMMKPLEYLAYRGIIREGEL